MMEVDGRLFFVHTDCAPHLPSRELKECDICIQKGMGWSDREFICSQCREDVKRVIAESRDLTSAREYWEKNESKLEELEFARTIYKGKLG